jgi:hypothetical protein
VPAATAAGAEAEATAAAVEETGPVAAGFVAGAAAGAVKPRSGGSKAASKGSKRQRRAPASQKQQQQQRQESAVEQQIEGTAAASPEKDAAAAVPAAEPVAEATEAATAAGEIPETAHTQARSKGPQLEKQHPQQKQQPEASVSADEESWRPAEHVLADVTRQQLGVAVGRRATIATLRAGSGAAAAGKGGRQQIAKGAGSTLTPVAFRTRHRHGR